jgi:hypothetical protein
MPSRSCPRTNGWPICAGQGANDPDAPQPGPTRQPKTVVFFNLQIGRSNFKLTLPAKTFGKSSSVDTANTCRHNATVSCQPCLWQG